MGVIYSESAHLPLLGGFSVIFDGLLFCSFVVLWCEMSHKLDHNTKEVPKQIMGRLSDRFVTVLQIKSFVKCVTTKYQTLNVVPYDESTDFKLHH